MPNIYPQSYLIFNDNNIFSEETFVRKDTATGVESDQNGAKVGLTIPNSSNTGTLFPVISGSYQVSGMPINVMVNKTGGVLHRTEFVWNKTVMTGQVTGSNCIRTFSPPVQPFVKISSSISGYGSGKTNAHLTDYPPIGLATLYSTKYKKTIISRVQGNCIEFATQTVDVNDDTEWNHSVISFAPTFDDLSNNLGINNGEKVGFKDYVHTGFQKDAPITLHSCSMCELNDGTILLFSHYRRERNIVSPPATEQNVRHSNEVGEGAPENNRIDTGDICMLSSSDGGDSWEVVRDNIIRDLDIEKKIPYLNKGAFSFKVACSGDFIRIVYSHVGGTSNEIAYKSSESDYRFYLKSIISSDRGATWAMVDPFPLSASGSRVPEVTADKEDYVDVELRDGYHLDNGLRTFHIFSRPHADEQINSDFGRTNMHSSGTPPTLIEDSKHLQNKDHDRFNATWSLCALDKYSGTFVIAVTADNRNVLHSSYPTSSGTHPTWLNDSPQIRPDVIILKASGIEQFSIIPRYGGADTTDNYQQGGHAGILLKSRKNWAARKDIGYYTTNDYPQALVQPYRVALCAGPDYIYCLVEASYYDEFGIHGALQLCGQIIPKNTFDDERTWLNWGHDIEGSMGARANGYFNMQMIWAGNCLALIHGIIPQRFTTASLDGPFSSDIGWNETNSQDGTRPPIYRMRVPARGVRYMIPPFLKNTDVGDDLGVGVLKDAYKIICQFIGRPATLPISNELGFYVSLEKSHGVRWSPLYSSIHKNEGFVGVPTVGSDIGAAYDGRWRLRKSTGANVEEVIDHLNLKYFKMTTGHAAQFAEKYKYVCADWHEGATARVTDTDSPTNKMAGTTNGSWVTGGVCRFVFESYYKASQVTTSQRTCWDFFGDTMGNIPSADKQVPIFGLSVLSFGENRYNSTSFSDGPPVSSGNDYGLFLGITKEKSFFITQFRIITGYGWPKLFIPGGVSSGSAPTVHDAAVADGTWPNIEWDASTFTSNIFSEDSRNEIIWTCAAQDNHKAGNVNMYVYTKAGPASNWKKWGPINAGPYPTSTSVTKERDIFDVGHVENSMTIWGQQLFQFGFLSGRLINPVASVPLIQKTGGVIIHDASMSSNNSCNTFNVKNAFFGQISSTDVDIYSVAGKPCSRQEIDLMNNVSMRWGGGSAFVGDKFTSDVEYTHSVRNIFLNSMSSEWRGKDFPAYNVYTNKNGRSFCSITVDDNSKFTDGDSITIQYDASNTKVFTAKTSIPSTWTNNFFKIGQNAFETAWNLKEAINNFRSLGWLFSASVKRDHSSRKYFVEITAFHSGNSTSSSYHDGRTVVLSMTETPPPMSAVSPTSGGSLAASVVPESVIIFDAEKSTTGGSNRFTGAEEICLFGTNFMEVMVQFCNDISFPSVYGAGIAESYVHNNAIYKFEVDGGIGNAGPVNHNSIKVKNGTLKRIVQKQIQTGTNFGTYEDTVIQPWGSEITSSFTDISNDSIIEGELKGKYLYVWSTDTNKLHWGRTYKIKNNIGRRIIVETDRGEALFEGVSRNFEIECFIFDNKHIITRNNNLPVAENASEYRYCKITMAYSGNYFVSLPEGHAKCSKIIAGEGLKPKFPFDWNFSESYRRNLGETKFINGSRFVNKYGEDLREIELKLTGDISKDRHSMVKSITNFSGGTDPFALLMDLNNPHSENTLIVRSNGDYEMSNEGWRRVDGEWVQVGDLSVTFTEEG